jgi:hypothetical protein
MNEVFGIRTILADADKWLWENEFEINDPLLNKSLPTNCLNRLHIISNGFRWNFFSILLHFFSCFISIFYSRQISFSSKYNSFRKIALNQVYDSKERGSTHRNRDSLKNSLNIICHSSNGFEESGKYQQQQKYFLKIFSGL